MKRAPSSSKVAFSEALAEMEQMLRNETRAKVLDALVDTRDVDASLTRLRDAMRSHAFPTAAGKSLRGVVDSLDNRTRREGLHVLQGWDFVEHRFPKDIAPILLVDYCARLGVSSDRVREATAVLLDQYFLALLSLCGVRAWDEGDANENLDRLTSALSHLQGPAGSGKQFVSDAETLLMLAVSYFHPEEHGYDLLVDRVSALDATHQMRFAIPCAALMSCHLRWGLRFMYKRDVGRMRADNGADYPLLLFALMTLGEQYVRCMSTGADRGVIVEGLLSALSADPWAFVDVAPPPLASRADWHSTVRGTLREHQQTLLEDFAALQPSPHAYSPLSFTCNFPTNATVAMAVLAVQGETHPPLNALFTREAEPTSDGSAIRLAQRLMEFATSDASRLGAGGVPLLAYDPYEAAHAYNTTLRTLRGVSRDSSRS